MTPFVVYGEAPGPNTDPLRPLYPHATTGAAAKLAALLGLSVDQYLARVQRLNALHDGKRPLGLYEARARVANHLNQTLQASPEAKFVFLGAKALHAAPAEYRKLKACQAAGPVLFIPHTSGANLWYNSAANKEQAAVALRAHLAAAGGLGTLPPAGTVRTPTEAWAGLVERGGCPPPPAGPGLRLEEIEWLLQRWWEDTCVTSSVGEIMNHSAAKRLMREEGLRLVPVLIEKLRADVPGQQWGWLTMLQKLTRRKPFPAEYVGRVQELKTSWLRWYDSTK